MPRITAFVARSFNPADEPKVKPILNFLDAFSPLGFVCVTAEPAEVERVSKKVQQKIDDCDAFVGVFTRRHPIYPPPEGLKAAFNVLRSKLTPSAWSAPPWVLQECGYALKAGKQLILFRESDVEIPGLQGDLEYIPFEPSSMTSAFQKASEMVNRLVARSAGIAVETVVSAVSESGQAEGSVAGTAAKEKLSEPADEPNLFSEMLEHIEERDWEAAERAYTKGLELTREKRPEHETFWKAVYHRRRAVAGHPTALDDLKSLASSNPDDPIPLAFLGSCLLAFEQFAEAADCYKAASEVCRGEDGIDYRTRAARCLSLAKRFEEARTMLVSTWASSQAASSESKFSILSGLHAVLKDAGDSFSAFAIGEMALHENPSRGDFRFSFGFEYDAPGYPELYLRHFRSICEKDHRNGGALNNLGVAHSRLGLRLNSVSYYKRALDLGDTLAASNLGNTYLNAGFAEEASHMLLEAQKKADCVPEVARCLAAIDERWKEEDEKVDSALETAKSQQDFLVSFGAAYLSGGAPPLDGQWIFPWGRILLGLDSGKLVGETVVKSPERNKLGFGSLYRLAPGATSDERFERVRFSGEMLGRACKYKITKQEVERADLSPGAGLRLAAGILGGLYESATDGYIVFGADGSTAKAAEVKNGKPSEYYEIRKES